VDDDVDATDTPEDTDLVSDADHDGVPLDRDCDDTNADVHPGAVESCNRADDDCDGLVDLDDVAFPGALGPFGEDVDDDGFGSDGPLTWRCSAPASGWSLVLGDCDDDDPDIRPDADETCDADVDDDCDGLADSEDPDLIATDDVAWFLYVDDDDDGYGATGRWICRDSLLPNVVPTPGDCDDADATTWPEACSGPDRNCDGVTGSSDHDGDGAIGCSDDGGTSDCDDADPAIHPAATEVCDGADNDCDRLVDADDPSLADATYFRSHAR
jgi:hypothetical protein